MMEFFWRRLRRGERGFTLIELLIVVAIIAILAAILIPNFLRSRAQSMVSASKGNLKNIGTALESYFVQNDGYPTTAQTLGALTPTFINAIPNDPCRGTETSKTYGYTATAGSYRIDTQSWANSTCLSVLGGLYYSPSGGLGETQP